MREVLNTIFYITRTGIRWRDLPHDLPNPSTVYYYFTKYLDDAFWEVVNDVLRKRVREEAAKDPDPSAVIIDSQSVKVTAIPGERGFDGGKKVNGRKRSVITDTMGLLTRVVLHAADIPDNVGGTMVADSVAPVITTIKKVFGDQHYGGQFADHVQRAYGWEVEVKRPPRDIMGFVPVAKRWGIERTFGWLTWSRRLAKDYEQYVEVSEAFVYVAIIHLMLQRLTRVVTS